MKNTIKNVALAALLVSATAAFGQTLPEPKNVLQLSADAQGEIAQDMLTMVLATTREGSDPGVVQTQLKQALEAALAKAKAAGQPGQMDVRTGNFSLQPRYTKEGKIGSWSGNAELVLEGRDFSRITSTAGKIDTMTVSRTAFGLSREQRLQAETEVQLRAIESFKTKASELAKGFGFPRYTLREISVNANSMSPPMPRMMAMAASKAVSDEAVPVEAGKTTVVVNVSGSVQLQQQ